MKNLLPALLCCWIYSFCTWLTETVHYNVQPTELPSFCPRNNSCPPGQHCYTINELAEHSDEFFSPSYINVTLTFACGIHKLTKNLTVQYLHSFVMAGMAGYEGYQYVVISFHTHASISNCVRITFFNVNVVNITTLIIQCPSIYLEGGQISVSSSYLTGNKAIDEIASIIHIAERNSTALLKNCTFTNNCFVKSSVSAGIKVINCSFHSYRHSFGSIIEAFSSSITLTGYVRFTHSYLGHGAAVCITSLNPSKFKLSSALKVAVDSTVFFENHLSASHGGALYVHGGVIDIEIQASVVFLHNKINVPIASQMIGGNGGALYMYYGGLNIHANASVYFSHNSAFRGGALYLRRTNTMIGQDAKLLFCDNTAAEGGAVYLAFADINAYAHGVVQFIRNTAIQGGAVFVHSYPSSICSAIIVGNSSTFIFSNNFALQGGALYIITSTFAIQVGLKSRIQFTNNTAANVGGAVYSEMQAAQPCMFQITDNSAVISFTTNNAGLSIGQHIYGSSIRYSKCDTDHSKMLWCNKTGKPYCWYSNQKVSDHAIITFQSGLNQTLSPVSSAPWRVCLCDSSGRPQCANFSQIFTRVSVYRGEPFTLYAYVVGFDFGTTIGSVYAELLYSNSFLGLSESIQLVKSSRKCTALKYRVYTKHTNEILQLQASVLSKSIYANNQITNKFNMLHGFKYIINMTITDYFSHDQGCYYEELLHTPVFINITLLPGCPPGLTLIDNSTKCACYSILSDSGFQCFVRNKSGYINWNNTAWVNATFSGGQSIGIIYNYFCPLHYCKLNNKTINIGKDPSNQCTSNRDGVLCGACMENFSLAIGSSRCIECANCHSVALLLAFAAAGIILVFFILLLNLTVTQGLINGIVFYANIIWDYKKAIFPSEVQANTYSLQVFIAWLNLDFGIESCFFVGLDAYWKTWLQFLFPFYIWAIAGVIIVACRYSSRLTNLIGSRAVPLLATLFLLSYMKLLRIIIDVTSVAVISQYPQNTSYAVWYLDGNLHYCHYPHIYLFIAAIATFVFLWLPYTLLFLFIQPLRRVSHLKQLNWINRLTPVYDAYLSPLKDKHQYWFGIMLLVRGILLLILTVSSIKNPELNVFTLSVVMTTLVVFMSVKKVYKQMNVRMLENAVLMNLIILSAGALYKWESATSKMTLLDISIGVAIVQFSVVIVWSFIKQLVSINSGCKKHESYNEILDENIVHEHECDHLNPTV